jgi:hypothetical protein
MEVENYIIVLSSIMKQFKIMIKISTVKTFDKLVESMFWSDELVYNSFFLYFVPFLRNEKNV